MRQRCNIAPERFAELAENSESEIAIASLDAADIRAVDFGAISKLFLGPAKRGPPLSQALAQQFQDSLIHLFKGCANGDYESTDDNTHLEQMDDDLDTLTP